MGIKVVFDFELNQIIIEGEEEDLTKVLKAAKELAPSVSEIRLVKPGTVKVNNGNQPAGLPNPPLANKGIRDFVRTLTLNSHFDRIAAVAYYINKIQNKQFFTVKEMNDLFGLCGFQKPKNMAVALSDTKRKRDYVENKGRDQWTVTTTGENLIMRMLERNTD
jgi:hypothetical protein